MKRIAAFRDQGWHVVGFTFHRIRDKADVPPFWENVHLGTTYNRRYLQRLAAFVGCVGILWKNRDRLGDCQTIYVVNTDNALLALLGRFFAGSRPPLVLELADVQPAMTGKGIVSKTFRAIERFVLSRIALLVTTSPAFVDQYFEPVQGYGGKVFLLENKVYPSTDLPLPKVSTDPVRGGHPWVIGCFGALRCRRSMELLHGLAQKLGDRVEIILRGYPAGTIADDFDKLLGNLPNFRFEGAYSYPDDLAEMYAGIDFNWTFDYSDPSGNSSWLLPNRIYEGGCFGVPAIGAQGTETGNWIERNQQGWTFEEPLEENLVRFFEGMEVGLWMRKKTHCSEMPRSAFTAEDDYRKLSEVLTQLSN